MTSGQKVVAVTGSSGHIGVKLLEHLEEMPGLGKLVAFDHKPLRAPVHNIAAYRLDVARPIADELARHRVTTVVHLASTWRPGAGRRDAAAVSELNRSALQGVLESSANSGVGHIIYLSSHTVYGAWPDMPLPVSEDTPRRPPTGFSYAQDHFQAEDMLLEFGDSSPDTRITIFRACPALGTMTSEAFLRELYFPGWVGLSDHNPPLQFVSDDDLARILCLAIERELAGVFNVAGGGVVFLNELARAMSVRRFRAPAALAYPLKRLTGGGLSSYSHFHDRWPAIMGSAKLDQATGYRYRRNAQECVTSFVSYGAEERQEFPVASRAR